MPRARDFDSQAPASVAVSGTWSQDQMEEEDDDDIDLYETTETGACGEAATGNADGLPELTEGERAAAGLDAAPAATKLG
eukprot:13406797-Alexandrium_andersonii.AAC.1